MYYLYEIKFPDGYFYIGITKNLNLRFSQHKRSKYPVGKKIRESGLEQKDIFNVLFSSDFEKDVLELEEFIVDDLLIANPKCLNLTFGGAKGGYFKNFQHTDLSKNNISNSLKGRVFSVEHKKKIGLKTKERLTGVKLSEKHKKNIGIASKRHWENPEYRRKQLGHMNGRIHSCETKNKISLAHQKGEKHHKAKAVLQFDNDKNLINEFGSIKIASNKTGLSVDRISRAIRGIRNTTNFIWEYK